MRNIKLGYIVIQMKETWSSTSVFLVHFLFFPIRFLISMYSFCFRLNHIWNFESLLAHHVMVVIELHRHTSNVIRFLKKISGHRENNTSLGNRRVLGKGRASGRRKFVWMSSVSPVQNENADIKIITMMLKYVRQLISITLFNFLCSKWLCLSYYVHVSQSFRR